MPALVGMQVVETNAHFFLHHLSYVKVCAKPTEQYQPDNWYSRGNEYHVHAGGDADAHL